MKQVLFFLLIAVTAQLVNAQSVGIGTTTPNASAQLDISSTTKGLLIPRMTSTNRAFISNPANGLLVYDTTQNRMYQYQDGAWRYFINDNYWRTSTTRNWVYNTTDSIGIGTSVPTQRLDVNGDIRSRNNLIADNNVTAQGTVSGAALATGGNIIVVGASVLSGDVTTNSDLIINNTAATMQLKSSSVNKGFFQLSGNNVRFGTNSGNTTGNLIMRMNGNDRVQINAAGDIDLDGKITRSSVTGVASLLPVCMGHIGSSGNVEFGSNNFSVAHPSANLYEITCTQFNAASILLVTPKSGVASYEAGFVSPGKMYVLGSSNFSFYFVVYNLN